MSSPDVMTVEQLAERWQVPKSFIWRRTRAGNIPCVRVGRYYRYRLDVIEDFERAGGMEPDA